MKTHYYKALGMFVAGLMIVTAPAYGAPKEKATLNPGKGGATTNQPTPTPTPRPTATLKKVEATKAQHIDLRAEMKQMNWKDGRNVVYSGAGVKLMADVKGGKVERWTAIDDKGKPLPTNAVQEKKGGPSADVKCEVCVTVILPKGETGQHCYEVDCSKIPPAKK